MDLDRVVSQMARNAQAIRTFVQGITDHEARWKPDADSWSMLEVINHLANEEREDFRARVDLTLHRPGEAWTGIDPEGWVTERGYNQRDLEQSLARFLSAREESLDWLRGLAQPEWEREREASFGRIRAGDLLASWVAHDLLHLRQLVELRWAYWVAQAEPYEVGYAGVW
ncbi:MAG: DinB family protein [Anaerolineae bacterium]